MKKLFLFALAAVILTGCSFEVREIDPDEEQETFTIDINNEEDDSEE